jgi:hypothetical protein
MSILEKLGKLKAAAIEIREKIVQFKGDHKMANSAISQIIDELPFPFKPFGKIIWDGLEKKEDGGEDIAKILERMAQSSEQEFAHIDSRLTLLMASVEESKEIGVEILDSNESVLEILGSKIDRLSLTAGQIDRKVEVVLNLLKAQKGKTEKSDYDIFLDYRVVFDRPAFKLKYTIDSDHPNYTRALQDIINAINTGIIVTRSGIEITRTSPKTFIRNDNWRNTMEQVETTLSQIIKMEFQWPNSNAPNATELWKKFYQDIDSMRDSIIISLNKIWDVLGIPALPIPSKTKSFGEYIVGDWSG